MEAALDLDSPPGRDVIGLAPVDPIARSIDREIFRGGKIMKNSAVIAPLLGFCLLAACRGSHTSADKKTGPSAQVYTVPEIDISGAPSGIVNLLKNVPSVFTDVFTKYTKIIAPNGKPIHILAQAGWTEDQIKKARNVLQFMLTDAPGTQYGNDKSAVANAMVLFNTEPEMHAARRGSLGSRTDLSMQDLRANECPAEGTEDYMNQMTRDTSFEEIWHLVHDNGIKVVLRGMIAEMRGANDAAAKAGWRAYPEDEPDEHPNEYMGVLIDNFFDLWTVPPKLYEGRTIGPDDIPPGTSHFGRYFAGSCVRMEKLDPGGFTLVQKFFPPYLTYTPELPESFDGTFSLSYDESLVYTAKSQHLVRVTLTGAKNANLIGNAYNNGLTGNAGDNILEGRMGNDRLSGGDGLDTAVFSGVSSEYKIVKDGRQTIVEDTRPHRDGTNILESIEILRFRDKDVQL
jgi:hypothetical protein